MIDQENLVKLNEQMKSKSLIFLSGEGLAVTFLSQIKNVTTEHIEIKNTVPYSIISSFVNRASYYLQAGTQLYSTSTIKSDSTTILFLPEKVKDLGESRQSERISFQSNGNAYCVFKNPVDNETVLRKRILDLSEDGLSLRSISPSRLFTSGQKINELQIEVDGKFLRKESGEVRYTRKIVAADGELFHQVGLKFLS